MMNRAKFLQNGKCGYILKPEFMFTNESYNLGEETEDKKVIKIQISRYSLFVEFLQYFFLSTYLSQQTDNSILRHFLNRKDLFPFRGAAGRGNTIYIRLEHSRSEIYQKSKEIPPSLGAMGALSCVFIA